MWISQKCKNLDILRTKHFFFKQKNSLITHQELLYDKNSFAAEVTFKGFELTFDCLIVYFPVVFPVWNICRKFQFASVDMYQKLSPEENLSHTARFQGFSNFLILLL